MFHSLLGEVKEIAVFMIICETLLHFTPSKNYTKYIKPVIAFMVLSKIMISILSFNTSDLKKTMEESMIRYEKQLQDVELTNMKEADIDVSEQTKIKLNPKLINDFSVKKAVIKKEYIDGIENCILVITLWKKDNTILVEPIDIIKDPSSEENRLRQIIADSLETDMENIKVVIET